MGLRSIQYPYSSEITIFFLALFFLKTASVKQLPSWNVSCPEECSCSLVFSKYFDAELKTVDCRWSQLHEIPSGIPEQAQVILFSNNNISSLFNLPDMSMLQQMDFSCNALEDISSRPMFGKYSKLRHLNLSSNSIQEIHHGAFSGLKHLEILDLSSNILHSIEHQDAFAGLNHLHKLYLGQNQIQSFHNGWVEGMVHLQELHLNQNKIRSILPDTITILKDLKQLVLSDNLLEDLPGETMAGMENLLYLDLSRNKISHIPTELLQQLPNLRDFTLNGNPIPRIRANDFLEMNVENVSLSYMPILTIVEKGAFHNMTNLRILNMHHNKQLFFIQPNSFINVPHLQWLRVQWNSLSALPEQVEESLPELSEVHVYGNPLYCDCNIHWIRQLLHQSNDNSTISFIRFPHADRIMCDNPTNLSISVPLIELPADSIPALCSPATIPLFNDSNQLEVGETLRLECHALGVPTPNIHWILSNGNRVNRTTHHFRASLTDDSVLVVRHVNARDAGTYACEASNELGYDISSTAVKVHTSNIRVVILRQSKNYITLTWSGTEDTVQSSDYKIIYNQAGSKGHKKEIHLRPFLRKYTITNLTPDTSYELCVAYVHASIYHKVHCLNITTLQETYLPVGITRISKQKVTLGVVIIFSLCFVGCIIGVIIKRWRRKGYEKPTSGEAGDTMSQIPLDNLYQPPSTPLCTSRTSLLPSSQA